jgi:hypothetical protein
LKIIKPQTFTSTEVTRASIATYFNSVGLLATAGVDTLRIGYDPVTLEPIGPIIESSATNFIYPSNGFNNATFWTISGTVTLTPNAAVSPTGANDAFLFSTSGSGGTLTSSSFSQTGAVLSVFVKRTGAGDGIFRLINEADLSTGAFFYFPVSGEPYVSLLGAGLTPFIQKLGNGWYRLAIRATALSTAFRLLTPMGQFYIFGAQGETNASPSPTSYIATTTAYGTRAADVLVGQPPLVLASNVSENDAPAWDPLETYAVGEQVTVLGDYHRVYEAVAPSTDKFPPDNVPSIWIDAGATNGWRMFDMSSGAERQTVATAVDETINVSLSVVGPVSSVVLLNVEGGQVSVVVKDSANTVIGELNESTLGLPRDTGWWDFFFGQRPDNTMFVFSDFNLPIGAPGTIQVTVDGGGQPARIGKLIVGEEVYIGCTKYGSSGGIIDFSRKQRDDFR